MYKFTNTLQKRRNSAVTLCSRAELARDMKCYQTVSWGNAASRFIRSSQGDLKGYLAESSPV